MTNRFTGLPLRLNLAPSRCLFLLTMLFLVDRLAVRGECPDPSWMLSTRMLDVPAGTFIMGRSDNESTFDDSLPRHDVYLNRYAISQYETTVGDFATVLNWAHGNDLLRTETGQKWAGEGNLYINESAPLVAVRFDHGQSPLIYSEGEFIPVVRSTNQGTTDTLMNYPMYFVSWYGSVAFCNWLSEMEGYSPAYDLTEMSLVDADQTITGTQFTNGYRLPTEAEWERAAAWNGTRRYTYGTSQDRLVLFYTANYNYFNPIGFTTFPYISPVGFYDGEHQFPALGSYSFYAVSPVGAFDMSGNILEWCNDWYDADYYSISPDSNPLGPEMEPQNGKVARGGSWNVAGSLTGTAYRLPQGADYTFSYLGFRLARSEVETPAAPSSVSFEASQSEITFNWQDNSDDECGFYIHTGLGSAPFFAPFAVPENTTTYTASTSPNEQIPLQVTAFNAMGISVRSALVAPYSLAVTPHAPMVSSVTSSSFQFSVDQEDTNPIVTFYACWLSPAELWIQTDGTLAEQPAWETKGAWINITVAELDSATPYRVSCIARNGDLINTSFSGETSAATNALLSYTAGANGEVIGQLSQEVNYGGSGTAVTAIPASNFQFLGWSDGSMENPRQDQNIEENISATALFGEIHHPGLWTIR